MGDTRSSAVPGGFRARAGVPAAVALLALAANLVVPAARAGAHALGDGRIVTVLDQVKPALPGVEITLRNTLASQLIASNTTATELSVLDDAGEPFLRVGSDGVMADLASPFWYRTVGPAGSTRIPEEARRPEAPPRWALVSKGSSWGWFDHRIHPQGLAASPELSKSRERAILLRWSVPLRYGPRKVAVTGRVEFRPRLGGFVPKLTSPAEPVPGVKVSLLAQGPVPGLFLENSTDQPLVVLGPDGEPFARLGPAAEVNRRSPFYVENERAKEEAPATAPDPTAEPEWQEVQATPRFAWLEFRARFAGQEPPKAAVEAKTPTALVNWKVPLVFLDRRLEITGTTSYVPGPEPPGQGLWTPRLGIFAALSASASGAVLVIARRRGRPATVIQPVRRPPK